MSGSETLTAARWRKEILVWARTWPESGFVMPSGRRRSAFRLVCACMGLADMARADGTLRGNRDWWNVKQCAAAMGMAHSTAEDTLKWLEAGGRLAKTPGAWTEYGRGTDMRSLVLTQAYGQASSSPLAQPLTPISGTPNANVTLTPSANVTLEPNANAELERWPTPLLPSHLVTLDGDVANATNGDGHVLVGSGNARSHSPRVLKVSEAELRRRALVPRVEGEPCEPWELPGAEA
jgi:hypothetical protein